MRTDTPDVFVGLASIPERQRSLESVVERLLPQAARIGVYLNRYDSVPRFLRHDRIEVARSQEYGDVRDNGKFHFLERSSCRYYATVDDDIEYPTDYLRRLRETLDATEQVAAVGVHGALYPDPVIHAFDSRVLLHFEQRVPQVMPVHLLGTGTTMFDQTQWGLRFDEFGTPGMADIWFARAARTRDAPLFAVQRKRRWLGAIRQEDGGALFHEGLRRNSEQLEGLRAAAPSAGGLDQLVDALVHSKRFRADIGVHQAVRLDRIRRQLGLAPLSTAATDRVRELLSAERSTWPNRAELDEDDVRILTEATLVILEDRAPGGLLLDALSVLDRLQRSQLLESDGRSELPRAVQIDTTSAQLDELRPVLLRRSLDSDSGRAVTVWAAAVGACEATPELAIDAAAGGARTGFESMPSFHERARQDPLAAASLLRRYVEVTGWRLPDINALRRAFGASFTAAEVTLPLAVAAQRSGHADVAQQLVRRSRTESPWDVDLRLMQARLGADDSGPCGLLRPVLGILDEALIDLGLEPLSHFIDDDREGACWLDLLRRSDSAPAALAPTPAPSVSVLMTTYNDEATIVPAATSVLESVDVEVELIVVDDCSTDATAELVDQLGDDRIQIIRNNRNVGPYVSRNVGLGRARGEYVAIADGDDWSHPARLSHQIDYLRAVRTALACTVAHVRILPSGELDLENHCRFLGDGPMSLLYRRDLTDHIGGFDHIRTRGDMEFMRRLVARFGVSSLVSLGTPLVLAMSTPTSNSKRFSDEDLALYRSASRRWHEKRRGLDDLYVPLEQGRAPFIAPHRLRVG